MRKHKIGLIILVVVGLWVLGVALSMADAPQRDVVLGAVAPDATIPAPTTVPDLTAGDLVIQYSGGPSRLCPGWNLYYTLRLTNTHTGQSFTNLSITDAIPAGTWFNEGEMSGDIIGTYHPASNTIYWDTPSLAPQQGIRIELILRSRSGPSDGTWITNTMRIDADQLAAPVEAAVGSVLDSSECPAPSATPTVTPSVTPTLTQTATVTATPTTTATPTSTPVLDRRLFLPLVYATY